MIQQTIISTGRPLPDLTTTSKRVHARIVVGRETVRPELVNNGSALGPPSIRRRHLSLSECTVMILTEVDAQHNEDAVDVLHLGKIRLILRARADEEEEIKYGDPTVLIDRRPNKKNTFKKNKRYNRLPN